MRITNDLVVDDYDWKNDSGDQWAQMAKICAERTAVELRFDTRSYRSAGSR